MLADTIGVGVPGQVKRLPAAPRTVDIPVGLHLHNTRNTGYANAYAGLEHGVTLFDASVGGLGGCPFAPRATGNIATEDLLYLLEGEGVDTGVDLDGVIGVAEWLSGVLGRPLPGLVHRADAPSDSGSTSPYFCCMSNSSPRARRPSGRRRLARDDRREPVLERVDHGRAHAARGASRRTPRACRARRSIDASGGPEERRRERLDQHRLVRRGGRAARRPRSSGDPGRSTASAGTLRRNTAAARSRASS